MSEANKYGQGDNQTMEARIIRNPALEVAAAESDEQWVKARYPEAVAERMFCGTPMLIWSGGIGKRGTCLGRHGMGDEALAWADAATKLGRRLEPKPDAEAIFCSDPDCVYPAGHESDHSPSAQPKPDAAGEAKGDISEVVHAQIFHHASGQRMLQVEVRRLVGTHTGLDTDVIEINPAKFAKWLRLVEVDSAPRNSALEDAAKEMAEALELVANREGYCVWCERNRPFHHKHCVVDVALAHFRALGGE